MSKKKLTVAIIGYGMRGKAYADYALKCPDELEVVAVAEPIDAVREEAIQLHNLKEEMAFKDWREVAALPKLADFIVLATQDNMHCEPAVEFIEKGYDILLEKPMAPTAKESKIIMEAAEKKGVKVVVCHVLRYTDFWGKVKELIDKDAVGEIMSVMHVEQVGYLHQGHSFVRGNWGNSVKSAPMILAKSCHDTDMLAWLINKQCKKVSSFGSLTHFTKENAPEGAPDYCFDGCPHGETCYYNALKFYSAKTNVWRGTVANKPNPTDEEVLEALKRGPYGRCVYKCDNDVVDHQVVNMEFEGGCTVSFSMNAFNFGARYMRIYGTKGSIYANNSTNEITYTSFDTKKEEVFNTTMIGEGIDSGHGGGDFGIMRDMVKYLRDGEKAVSISTIRDSYMSHLIAFAAEESRLSGKTIDICEFSNEI